MIHKNELLFVTCEHLLAGDDDCNKSFQLIGFYTTCVIANVFNQKSSVVATQDEDLVNLDPMGCHGDQ